MGAKGEGGEFWGGGGAGMYVGQKTETERQSFREANVLRTRFRGHFRLKCNFACCIFVWFEEDMRPALL
jgi:hypothetical protein